MLKNFLRYAAVSAALCYNACQPPEEDLESKCQGEVLFEDEFEGEELDEGKWENYCGEGELRAYVLSNGELRMNPDERGGCILQSRSTYTLGNDTLCFGARWKVREREGTDFDVGFYNNSDPRQSGASFFIGYGVKDLTCTVFSGDENDDQNCNIDVTRNYTYQFSANRNIVKFYINGNSVANSNFGLRSDLSFLIEAACQSSDDKEKTCYLDYIKLSRK